MSESPAPASPGPWPALRSALRGYPASAVLLAMLLVLLIVVLGSFAIDAIWAAQWESLGAPLSARLRGTCYWMADARLLTNIAGNGYTDYYVSFNLRHLTVLPDRSWWPVFVNLQALMLHLTRGYYCSGWLVNLIAMTLLPPVIHGITKSTRPLLLAGVALLPFGIWLYASLAEGVFLLVSAVLLWVCLMRPSAHWGVNVARGMFALLWGIVVGLTKPNAIALLPPFGILALTQAWAYWRAAPPGKPALARLLDDANPAWTPLLGTLGMLTGLSLWFYQTSGYYPLYVLMVQRTLWYREFQGGSLLGFLYHVMTGWHAVLGGRGLPDPTSMMQFAALTLAGILALRDVPPRFAPGRPAHRPPLYAVVGILTVFVLMFSTGQAHSIERYYSANIFFVITCLHFVYGHPDEPPLAALPRIVRARQAGALRAALRLVVFVCTLALFGLETITVVFYGI